MYNELRNRDVKEVAIRKQKVARLENGKRTGSVARRCVGRESHNSRSGLYQVPWGLGTMYEK